MKKLTNILYRDLVFWDTVDQSIFVLLRVIGVSTERYKFQAANTGDIRMVARVKGEHGNSWLDAIYYFFSMSPDCFVADGNYLIDMRSTDPAVFGKRELLVYLWKLANGAENGLITEICRNLDRVFRKEEGLEYDEEFHDWLLKNPQEVRLARQVWNDLYAEWYKYVSRHYNKALKGTDGISRQRFSVRVLEGRRNREIGEVGPSLMKMFDRLQLVDRTLCHIEMGPYQSDRAGNAITAEYLRCVMDQHRFPEKYLPDIKKILRRDQKWRLDWQKPRMQDQMLLPCFAYVRSDQLYLFDHEDDSSNFSFQATPFRQKTPIAKLIYGQDTNFTDIPKEFLYALSGGSWERFCSIAKIVCYAVSAGKLYPGVIVVNEETCGDLFAMLEWISGRWEDLVWKPLSLKAMSRIEMKDDLIDLKIDGRLMGVCTDDAQRLNPEQWERLRKLFSGATITYKDAILGRKMHKNMMQWFLIGDDKTFRKLEAHDIKAIAAPVSRVPDEIEKRASLWLQLVLPLWGFMLHKKMVPVTPSANANMPTVRYFVENCCEMIDEDGVFLPARELYDNYAAFCQNLSHRDILKFKDFNDVLETEYGLKRTRYHVPGGSNKTGFRRIRFVGMPSKGPQSLEQTALDREQFYERLDQIAVEVKTHFPDWPFADLF